MKDMKYAEILNANKAIEASFSESSSSYRIDLLSNLTTNSLKDILEYSLRLHNLYANVYVGDYDNIVQDSAKLKDTNLVIVFLDAVNLIDGAHYKVDLMNESEINSLLGKVRSEIDIIFQNLRNTPLVLMNSFSSALFNTLTLKKSNFESVCLALNQYVQENLPNNFLLVDIDKIFASISVGRSYDSRFFYSSKALYTVDFYKEYATYVLPAIKSVNGMAKKALIFDCDNTLWKGVLGEDGFDNISMSSQTQDGVVFEEVQSIALNLAKNGILLGLCSKNNMEDVDEVLFNHPNMTIKSKDIVIKKVNWQDKVTNLKEISNELNIGLDSIVFVDDSSFEINLVKESLPQVTVFQVPSRLSDYPRMLRECISLFFNFSRTDEDLKKTEIYQTQVLRELERDKFHTIDDYLRSLEMKVTINVDALSLVPRMAQLTQKTNQFNLTTKRYTESDIEQFVKSPEYIVICFGVSDKFGDNGIVGLLIISIKEQTAEFDTFLMSCRVIGRGIEAFVLNFSINYLKKQGIKIGLGRYNQTSKNHQVCDFYEENGFSVMSSTATEKLYSADLNTFTTQKIDYLELMDV